MSGATLVVDVLTVGGIGIDEFNLSAELFENLFIQDRGGAVGTI